MPWSCAPGTCTAFTTAHPTSLPPRHCRYTGGFSESSPTIKMFWRTVADMSPAQRGALLRFITASSRAPLGGFAHLQPPLTLHCVPCAAAPLAAIGAGKDVERLPTAATCKLQAVQVQLTQHIALATSNHGYWFKPFDLCRSCRACPSLYKCSNCVPSSRRACHGPIQMLPALVPPVDSLQVSTLSSCPTTGGTAHCGPSSWRPSTLGRALTCHSLCPVFDLAAGPPVWQLKWVLTLM